MTSVAHPLDGHFRRFWWAATLSSAGDGLRLTALPLLALTATTDPREIAAVTAAGFAAWPLFGLLGGAIADRVDRRTALWLVDLCRAIVMLALTALVISTGTAPIALLAGLAFLLGVAETVFDSAADGLLPTLVAPRALPRANAQLQSAQTLTGQVLGPPTGAALFATAAALPFALDAASFLAAAALIAAMPAAARPAERQAAAEQSVAPGLRAEIRSGIRWLWHQPVLRTLVVITAGLAVGSGALLALLVLYAREALGLGSAGYGLLFSSYAVGSIAGAAAAPRLLRRVSAGPLLLGAAATAPAVFAALGLTSSPVHAAAALAAFGVAAGLWSVTVVTLRQALVPGPLLGRVSSVYTSVSVTLVAVGAALAGVIAHQTSIPAALLSCSLVMGLTVLLTGRGVLSAALPQPPAATLAEQ